MAENCTWRELPQTTTSFHYLTVQKRNSNSSAELLQDQMILVKPCPSLYIRPSQKKIKHQNNSAPISILYPFWTNPRMYNGDLRKHNLLVQSMNPICTDRGQECYYKTDPDQWSGPGQLLFFTQLQIMLKNKF